MQQERNNAVQSNEMQALHSVHWWTWPGCNSALQAATNMKLDFLRSIAAAQMMTLLELHFAALSSGLFP